MFLGVATSTACVNEQLSVPDSHTIKKSVPQKLIQTLEKQNHLLQSPTCIDSMTRSGNVIVLVRYRAGSRHAWRLTWKLLLARLIHQQPAKNLKIQRKKIEYVVAGNQLPICRSGRPSNPANLLVSSHSGHRMISIVYCPFLILGSGRPENHHLPRPLVGWSWRQPKENVHLQWQPSHCSQFFSPTSS